MQRTAQQHAEKKKFT